MFDKYVVKAGDTLWGISNQYGVSVTELAELNAVDANTLQVGQVLKIPSKSGTNPDNMFMYTVKKGDTLWGIAKKYGIGVDSIKNLNYLKNNDLYIGQVLRIPEMYTKPEDMYLPGYTNYTVKSGDTLYSIAKKFNISVDTIIQDNSLSNNTLSVGKNLKIRSVDDSLDACFGEEYILPDEFVNKYQEYVVKKGDNLYDIARRYGVSINDIMVASGINSSNLSIGQILKIPNANASSINYVVKSGDSLWSIAKKYNTTVNDIVNKNNLKSTNLSIGQVLRI